MLKHTVLRNRVTSYFSTKLAATFAKNPEPNKTCTPLCATASSLLYISPSLASFISSYGGFTFLSPLLNMGSSHSVQVENFRTSVTALMQGIRDGAHDVRPIDEWACYNENGTLNDDNFEEYLDQEEDEATAKRKFMYLLMDMIESAASSLSIEHKLSLDTIGGPPLKRSRHAQKFKDPMTGVISPMTPQRSLRWMMYIQNPRVDDVQWNRVFRKRF